MTEHNFYNLKFGFPYIYPSTLKEKDCNIVRACIAGSRHSHNIKFNSYGILNFSDDDKQHLNPTYEANEKFNRLRTNCVEFAINVKGGDGKYDRLFLYKSKGHHINNWGYVMYNTKTCKQKHKYFIYDNIADIILHINKELNAMLWHSYPGDVRGHHDYDTSLNFTTKRIKRNDRFVIMYPELPSATYRTVNKGIMNPHKYNKVTNNG